MEYTVINQTEQPGDMQVLLSGQFTFADNFKFKQILELLEDAQVKALTLHFGGIDFIDSAGLGMLLLMRDECQIRSVALSIIATHGQVQKIFTISKFDQLFSMSEGSDATRH